MSDFDLLIGANIRAARVAQKMRQEDLALAVGDQGSQVSRWESGRVGISTSSLEKVSRELGVSMAELTRWPLSPRRWPLKCSPSCCHNSGGYPPEGQRWLLDQLRSGTIRPRWPWLALGWVSRCQGEGVRSPSSARLW